MSIASRKIIIYILTFIVLAVVGILIQAAFITAPVHSSLTHSLVQSIATVIAIFVGGAALYRYYVSENKSSALLFIGVAFLATALIDAYHTIVTSMWFIQSFPQVPSAVSRWSWVATRISLSTLLLLSLFNIFEKSKNRHTNEIIIYSVISTLTFVTLFYFMFFSPPFPTYPKAYIARPEELIPGVIFLIVLIGYLKKGKWKTDKLDHWIVLCLITSVVCQFFYMGESKELFDLTYMSSHYLKILSYLMVYMGIT